MSWTRVREITNAVNQRVNIWDVEEDLKQDKALKEIRRGAVRELGVLIFDPEQFADQQDLLTQANYQLDDEKLFEYANLSREIRHSISEKVGDLIDEQMVPEIEN